MRIPSRTCEKSGIPLPQVPQRLCSTDHTLCEIPRHHTTPSSKPDNQTWRRVSLRRWRAPVMIDHETIDSDDHLRIGLELT